MLNLSCLKLFLMYSKKVLAIEIMEVQNLQNIHDPQCQSECFFSNFACKFSVTFDSLSLFFFYICSQTKDKMVIFKFAALIFDLFIKECQVDINNFFFF